jgi:hypothetical protein
MMEYGQFAAWQGAQAAQAQAAQAQAAQAAQAAERDRERNFLLLLEHAGPDTRPSRERTTPMTDYCTLDLSRTRFDVLDVVVDGKPITLDVDTAKQYFESVVLTPAKSKLKSASDAVSRSRAVFISSAQISQIEVRVDTGGTRKPKVTKDQVEVYGDVHQVSLGVGRRYLQQLAEKRFPEPAVDLPRFLPWWKDIGNKREMRVWRTRIVYAATVQPVEFADESTYGWGYPMMGIQRELERLGSEGWSLVHVSEDRGLYKGLDSDNESRLVGVRYLLARD